MSVITVNTYGATPCILVQRPTDAAYNVIIYVHLHTYPHTRLYTSISFCFKINGAPTFVTDDLIDDRVCLI